MPAPPKKPTAAWRLKLGRAIPWLLAGTVSALLLQVWLAATGLFGGAGYLDAHALFANAVIRLLYTLILVVGFVGADWRIGVVGVVLTLLLEMQYPLIEAVEPAVTGLHAANGAIMLAVVLGALIARLPWTPRARPAPKAEPGVVRAPLKPGPQA